MPTPFELVVVHVSGKCPQFLLNTTVGTGTPLHSHSILKSAPSGNFINGGGGLIAATGTEK